MQVNLTTKISAYLEATPSILKEYATKEYVAENYVAKNPTDETESSQSSQG